MESIDYRDMLNQINIRMAIIMDISLEEDTYNEEWLELDRIKNSIYKILKIKKAQDDKR